VKAARDFFPWRLLIASVLISLVPLANTEPVEPISPAQPNPGLLGGLMRINFALWKTSSIFVTS
jgi:hypothetical protein